MNDATVRITERLERDKVLDSFLYMSNQIKENGFIEAEFKMLCEKEFENTFSCLTGKESIVFNILNKILFRRLRLFILRKKYKCDYWYLLENILVCEPQF